MIIGRNGILSILKNSTPNKVGNRHAILHKLKIILVVMVMLAMLALVVLYPVSPPDGAIYSNSPVLRTSEGLCDVEVDQDVLKLIDFPQENSKQNIGHLRRIGNGYYEVQIAVGKQTKGHFYCRFGLIGARFYDDGYRYKGFGWRNFWRRTPESEILEK